MHPSIIINNHQHHIPDNGHTAADRPEDHRRDKTNSDSSTSSPRYVLPLSSSSPSSSIIIDITYLTTVTLQQTGLQTTDETKLTATAAPVLHATSFHYHHHHHHHVPDNGHTAAHRSADHRHDPTDSTSSHYASFRHRHHQHHHHHHQHIPGNGHIAVFCRPRMCRRELTAAAAAVLNNASFRHYHHHHQ